MFLSSQHEQCFREFEQKIKPLRQRQKITLNDKEKRNMNIFIMNEQIYQKLLAFIYAFTGIEQFCMQAKKDRKMFKVHVWNKYKPPLEFDHLRINFKPLSFQEISFLDLIMHFLQQSTTVDTAMAFPYPFYRVAYLGEREFTLFANAWRLTAGHKRRNPLSFKMNLENADKRKWDSILDQLHEKLFSTKERLEQKIREKKVYNNGILTRLYQNHQITLKPEHAERIIQAAAYLRYYQTENLDQWANYFIQKYPFILDYELLFEGERVINGGINSFNEIPDMLLKLNEEEYPLVMQAIVHLFQIPVGEGKVAIDTTKTSVR